MPEIVRSHGLRVVVYPDDHEPIHVHVQKADGEIKVNALTLELMTVKGDVSNRDIRRAVMLVAEHQVAIEEKWRELHGNR